jgi:hypothetical protein
MHACGHMICCPIVFLAVFAFGSARDEISMRDTTACGMSELERISVSGVLDIAS